MVAFNALTTETTFTPPSLRPKHGPSPENTQTLITLPSTPSPPPSPPPLRSSSSWTSPRRHQNEQDDEAQYPDREPLLSNQSNNSNSKQPRTRHGYTSSPQPQRSSSPSPWRNSFITGILSWIWVYIHNCYNRITVWLFPHEPEPLDLHSTIFFIAQVPMLILVAFTWIPCFVAWLLGIRTSQAGDRDKSQGMRRGWSARLALALSFLKCYLRYAERLTIEECQSRSRSIPFMTAPAGIRINKVKIPTFPYRSKAEAIVYDCLTDQERALLPHLNNGKTRDGKQEHELSVRVQQETDRDIDFIQNQYQKEQHSAQGHGQREDQFAEGLDAEWLEYIGPDEIGAETGADANKAAVLYFHGGGYYTGSKEEHRVLIGPLVKRLGKNVRIFIINYRLAPQYPFPAALIDALSSYMWLLDQSVSESFGQGPLNNSGSGSGVLHDRFQPNQIVFMGDSAGGGLALSLSLLLRDHGSLPQPLSIVAWSPWLDLTQALPSFKENAITDCIPYEDFTHSHSAVVDEMFSMQSQDVDVEEDGAYNAGPRIRQRAQVYCPDSCLRMKYVSPLFETDFSGIPSVFITCGSAERFANECVLMAARLEDQQQPCRIDIHEDMPHIFPLFRFHASSAAALDRTSAYIREIVNKDRATGSYGENEVAISISSSLSSSLSSSAASSPVLLSKQLEKSPTTNSDTSATLSSGNPLEYAKRPFEMQRVNSSSSMSSTVSDESSTSSITSLSKRQSLPSRRHGIVKDKDKDLKHKSLDSTTDFDIPSRRVQTTVNVVDLSGTSVMSFHKQNRHGSCETAVVKLMKASGRRRHRKQEALSLKDVVSNATLYEWEVLLKTSEIPTRIWPHPPTTMTRKL